MAQTVESFGDFPPVIPMKLTTGADFGLTIENLDDDDVTPVNYAAGAALKFVFSNGTEWAATVSGANATWAVDKAAVDLIQEPATYRLKYTDTAGNDAVIYKGPVYRDDQGN